ncbi:hypothetical protein [Burkholderia plantarii]|nr:hypothetical protein [Burkholderia plantarii]
MPPTPMTFRFPPRHASLLLAAIALSACTAPGFDEPCGIHCAPPVLPAVAPYHHLRHGVVTSSGWFGISTDDVVDFDTGTLSVIDWEPQASASGLRPLLKRRRDIALAADDLALLRTTAAAIWRAGEPLPPGRASLENGWSIRVIDGDTARTEQGIGEPGGDGRYLYALLGRIVSQRFHYVVPVDPLWYSSWFCFPYPSGRPAGVPVLHARQPGHAGFRFSAPGAGQTCFR